MKYGIVLTHLAQVLINVENLALMSRLKNSEVCPVRQIKWDALLKCRYIRYRHINTAILMLKGKPDNQTSILARLSPFSSLQLTQLRARLAKASHNPLQRSHHRNQPILKSAD